MAKADFVAELALYEATAVTAVQAHESIEIEMEPIDRLALPSGYGAEMHAQIDKDIDTSVRALYSCFSCLALFELLDFA
jgi:hypothetical protein